MIESIVSGIKDTLSHGLYGLLDLLLWLLSIIVKIVLIPVDMLFKFIMPDFSGVLTNFSNSLIQLSSAPFAFFFNLLPPITKTIIVLWLSLLISYYTILWTYRGIILIPKVINKIKFW